MSKRKIIIINDDFPPYSSGGAAIIAYNQALGLRENGFEVIVLTTINDFKNEGVFYENDIKIIKIYYKHNPRYRSYVAIYNKFLTRKLKSILIQEKPEIIHFHNIHSNFSYYSLYVASKICKKVFITIHDSMSFHYSKLYPKDKFNLSKDNYRISALRQIKDFRFRYNPFRNILIKYYLKFPNKIIAVSDALKDALEVNGIKNLITIHNGIDTCKWVLKKDEMDEFKNKYGLNNKKVLMFCGRLSRAKGGELIVKCIPKIMSAIPEFALLIVGEVEKETSNMLKIAENLNISDRLVFSGKILGDSLIKAYGACNMVVVPSLCFDWFPTVNLEAMAMKKPIVATCFGGSSEIVKNNINGYIINPYIENDVVKAIVSILNDSELAQEFGSAGYQSIIDDFTLDKYIQKTLSCYNKYI